MVDKLSPLQLAEIRKAFSSCDRDGNGYLDAQELKLAIINITDQIPTEDELAKIMMMVDKNGDGRIEIEEFVEAVATWMNDEDYKTTVRKRKVPENERIDIHKKIKGFFEQFHQESELNRIRKALEQGSSKLNITNDETFNDDAADTMDLEGSISSRLSSEAKLKFLTEYRSTMQNIPTILEALADPFRQSEATQCIARLLSIVEVFNTPVERRSIVDDIVPLFEIIVQQGVAQSLAKLLDSNNAQVQWEAIRALTYIAPGPRIASTPLDSVLHPSQMFFKRMLIQFNVVETYIRLIQFSQLVSIKEQAILALSAIAAHNPEARDFVLKASGLNAVLSQISQNTPTSLLRKIAWALSIFVGVTHPNGSLPQWSQISGALEPLSSLLWVDDEEIICVVCPALSLILPGMPEMTVDRKLMDLSKSQSPRTARAALTTIKHIINYDNIQLTTFLSNCSLLVNLRELLLSQFPEVRYEICQILLLLAGSKGQIGAILQYEIHLQMIKVFQNDAECRSLLMKLFKYLTRSTMEHTDILVRGGLIHLACQGLSYFKSYDDLLTKVYKYTGATYDFPFGHDTILTLDNILNFGEMETEYTHRVNRYALMFTMENLDKIGGILETLRTKIHQEEINAWKQMYGGLSLEQRVQNLLFKIFQARTQALEQGIEPRLSGQILEWLQDLSSRLYKEESQSQLTSSTVPFDHSAIFKIEYKDEIRVLTLPKSIPFHSFLESVQQKIAVDESIRLTYLDEEDDEVTIDSSDLFSQAIQRYADQKSIKIRVHKLQKEETAEGSQMEEEKLRSSLTSSNNNNNNNNNNVSEKDDKNTKARKVEVEGALAGPPQKAPSQTSSQESSSQPSSQRMSGNNTLRSSSLTVPKLSDDSQKLLETKPEIPSTFSFNLDEVKLQNARHQINQTHFKPDEIEQLHTKWKTQCSSDGTVSRQDFCSGLMSLGVKDPLLIEQYYNAFDRDKDGRIDFKEFLAGLSIVRRGTLQERLQFMFRAYDSDGNGVLDETEVYNMLKATAIARGQMVSHQMLTEMVKKTFEIADENNDGVLSYEEFEKAVSSQKLIIGWFQDLPF